jgi:hypothetical protein
MPSRRGALLPSKRRPARPAPAPRPPVARPRPPRTLITKVPTKVPTKEPQWERPSQRLAKKVKETLPAGWEQHKDPSTKRVYYFNRKTKETQWARPSATDETMRCGEDITYTIDRIRRDNEDLAKRGETKRHVLSDPPTEKDCDESKIAKAHRLEDLELVNKDIVKYITENPLPKLGGNDYPINYNFEENLADGNCFYYAVIRSMQRKAYPTENPLNNKPGIQKKPQSDNLSPAAVAKFKQQIIDSSKNNKNLIDIIVENPDITREKKQNLKDNYVWAEDLSIQATANYLNCCIYIMYPKNSDKFGLPFEDSWYVFFPDKHDNPSIPIFENEEEITKYGGTKIISPHRKINSGKTTTPSKVIISDKLKQESEIREYTNPSVDTGDNIIKKAGFVQDDYKKDQQTFRQESRNLVLKDYITVSGNCKYKNKIFILFRGGGHFVSIEPQISSTISNLPENWEMKKDTQGRVYYVDHHTRTTQWEKPVSKLKEKFDALRKIIPKNASSPSQPKKITITDRLVELEKRREAIINQIHTKNKELADKPGDNTIKQEIHKLEQERDLIANEYNKLNEKMEQELLTSLHGRRRSKNGKKRRQSRRNQNSKSGKQSKQSKHGKHGKRSKHGKKRRKSSKKEKKNN